MTQSAVPLVGCPKTAAMMIVAVFALSSFVIVEPAPFDLAFIVLTGVLLLRLHPLLHRDLLLPVAILGGFALCNAVSGMFATEIPLMMLFMAVTFFMIFVGVVLFAMVATWPDAAHFVLTGYCISSVISTVITLAAFVGLLPLDMVMFDPSRIQAFFKDPNVYGPSLVISILYLMALLERQPRRPGWWPAIFLALLSLVLGVVFSASRAAWMNLALSLALYLGLRAWESRGRGAGRYWVTVAIVLAVIGGGSIGVISLTHYGDFIDERAAMQDYDADRFGAQQEGIDIAFREPLGLGPGQFEPRVDMHGVSAHSLYVRTILENGIAGFVCVFLFFGLTLLVAFRSALIGGPLAAPGAVVAASLAGVLVNSAFVDTLHWRSLWIQVGLAWGLYVICIQPQPANAASSARHTAGPVARPFPPLPS